MASPIGHVLAGIAVSWGADLAAGRGSGTASRSASWYRRAGGGLTFVCATLAAAPDLDLLVSGLHRTVTHSLMSAFLVACLAGLAAARAGLPVARVALMCAGAWATHMLLDWVSVDRSLPAGIQLLWPFDDRWFISDWAVFAGTERRQIFSAATMRLNAAAVLREVVILMPVVVGVWLVREKALAGLAPELPGGDHPAE